MYQALVSQEGSFLTKRLRRTLKGLSFSRKSATNTSNLKLEKNFEENSKSVWVLKDERKKLHIKMKVKLLVPLLRINPKSNFIKESWKELWRNSFQMKIDIRKFDMEIHKYSEGKLTRTLKEFFPDEYRHQKLRYGELVKTCLTSSVRESWKELWNQEYWVSWKELWRLSLPSQIFFYPEMTNRIDLITHQLSYYK